jgi:ubiquinone/menaquinone biosynthesis C-methylase UbiE
LVDYVNVQPGDHVLDVATGTGEVLLAAAERCGDTGRVLGIDLTAAMLDRAAAVIRDRHVSNVELREMDADQLALPDETFDVALSAFALSAFPNRSRALAECHRVLRSGGRIGLLDAPDWYFQHDPRWYWHEEVLRSFEALDLGNTVDSEPPALRATLESAGFAAVEPTEATFDLVFNDEEEWWNWSWSHGTRRLFEAVPPTRLDELKRRLFLGLQYCRATDGTIRGLMRATMVRAEAIADED